jgi:hypothetical protein
MSGMAWNLASLENVPVAGWIVLFAGAAFIGEYAVLRFRQRRSVRQAEHAERRLVYFAAALRNHAVASMQRLPDTLEELKLPDSQALVYRPAPRLNLDERLILLHDREPTHKVLEFPMLRDGRGLVLCSGRLLVVSEDAFEKLIAADDALRQRLGLDQPGSPAEENAEHGPRR